MTVVLVIQILRGTKDSNFTSPAEVSKVVQQPQEQGSDSPVGKWQTGCPGEQPAGTSICLVVNRRAWGPVQPQTPRAELPVIKALLADRSLWFVVVSVVTIAIPGPCTLEVVTSS